MENRFRVNHPVFSFLVRYFSFERSILHSCGVTVKATISDANKETMYAIPSGFSIRPSIPERKNSGIKATIIIRVALKIEALISFDASKTTVNADCLSVFGFR